MVQKFEGIVLNGQPIVNKYDCMPTVDPIRYDYRSLYPVDIVIEHQKDTCEFVDNRPLNALQYKLNEILYTHADLYIHAETG